MEGEVQETAILIGLVTPQQGERKTQEYLDELKSVACCYGYSPDAVDRMIAAGFTTDEVEEFLYDGGMY